MIEASTEDIPSTPPRIDDYLRQVRSAQPVAGLLHLFDEYTYASDVLVTLSCGHVEWCFPADPPMVACTQCYLLAVLKWMQGHRPPSIFPVQATGPDGEREVWGG